MLFPNPLLSIQQHLLPAVVFGVLLLAYGITEYAGRRSTWKQGAPWRPRSTQNESTYLFILTAALGSFAIDLGSFFSGWPGLLPALLLPLGVALAGLGFAMRIWSMRALGRFYTNPITIHPDHELVRGGPYRWVRHPVYTGGLLVLLAFPLVLGSLIGLVATLAICLAVYRGRIEAEESALRARFGAVYSEYAERTYRLLPGLY
ncbi:MAG: methyltransferase family protein [Thermoplasmata archaeon]